MRYSKATYATDGSRETVWTAGSPSPEAPAWLAVDVGEGPARLLFNWSANGSFNYEETEYGSPGAYRIAVSADSTDGENGAWTSVVTVRRVTTHGRMHSFGFVGQRWVKLIVTETPNPSPNGVQIDAIELHDISGGLGDTWFFMGDSITALAFGRSPAPGHAFAELIHKKHRAYFPSVLNGGVGGHKTDEGLQHVDEWIAQNPDARFWAIGYGTNDAAGDDADVAAFRRNLQTIVVRLKQAGRVPILATIPFASDGEHPHIARFNQAIDDLRRANSLPRGPDLFAWFALHPEELADGLHPNDDGIHSINRLWADAAASFYE